MEAMRANEGKVQPSSHLCFHFKLETIHHVSINPLFLFYCPIFLKYLRREYSHLFEIVDQRIVLANNIGQLRNGAKFGSNDLIQEVIEV